MGDQEYERLTNIAGLMEPEYDGKMSHWSGSPFEWMLRFGAKTKGEIGERMVLEFIGSSEFDTEWIKSNGPFDGWIGSLRAEIKFAMFTNPDRFWFNAIRDDPYDILICFGILPHEAKMWVIPKATIKEWWNDTMILTVGEGGDPSRTDGYYQAHKKLVVNALEPEEWMKPYGGSLEEGLTVLRSHSPGPLKQYNFKNMFPLPTAERKKDERQMELISINGARCE